MLTHEFLFELIDGFEVLELRRQFSPEVPALPRLIRQVPVEVDISKVLVYTGDVGISFKDTPEQFLGLVLPAEARRRSSRRRPR